MDDVQRFFAHHREKLLRYLDGLAPGSPRDPDPLDYVAQVLEAWARLSRSVAVPEPSATERTFWYALYLFEELVELPTRDSIDPYERMMMENLARVRELLRANAELPEGLHATRPGEHQL